MSRLKVAILAPFAAFVLILAVGLSAGIYWWYSTDKAIEQQESLQVAESAFRDALAEQARAMSAALSVLLYLPALRETYAAGDRQALFAAAKPVFRNLQVNQGFTHLYFIDPQGTAFLRVHAPEDYGDVIDRQTLHDAQRLQSRSVGLELGPLGTLTLRVVMPWLTADAGLLGYVELGEEIDHLAAQVEQAIKKHLIIVVPKRLLVRKAWEEGLRAFGRKRSWDTFDHYVYAFEGGSPVPPDVMRVLREPGLDMAGLRDEVATDGQRFEISASPIVDAAGQQVATTIVWEDVTREHRTARAVLAAAGLGSLALGLALVAIFWGVLDRTERQLARMSSDRTRYQLLSQRDSLTGVLNRRAFQALFTHEASLARSTGQALSLLMMDVDHFKSVNDRYGHVVGDQVLRSVARVLSRTIRATDALARYGGEEFAIVLPNTDTRDAVNSGERCRAAVAGTVVGMPDGSSNTITVSVGVATLNKDLQSGPALLHAADAALYLAKREGRNRVYVHRAAP